jgi:hypothetical protein
MLTKIGEKMGRLVPYIYPNASNRTRKNNSHKNTKYIEANKTQKMLILPRSAIISPGNNINSAAAKMNTAIAIDI